MPDGLDNRHDVLMLILGLIFVIGLMEFFVYCPDSVYLWVHNLLK